MLTWRDTIDMWLLAAVWGASFLFLRVAAPELGPVVVAAGRVLGAAAVLLPLVAWHGHAGAARAVWPQLLLSGIVTCVLPFLGLSQAARSIPAGPLSILNATTPLWGALVGWLWAREPLRGGTALGLLMGLGGVAWLAGHRSPLDVPLDPMAVALALGATLCYALGVHHSRRHLSGLPPLAVSGGSLAAAGLVLLGPAWWLGPQDGHGQAVPWSGVPAIAWAALAALAVVCTALAYLRFYRLIERIGPSRAMTVTFLIPVFGMLWGALWLDETISLTMVLSTAVIVAGTVLSTRGAQARR